jgi:RNA polymerase sigma-70 factor, ECF subfamily
MNSALAGHSRNVLLAFAQRPREVREGPDSLEAPDKDTLARLTASIREHYRFIWRSLRRFGVPQADLDDACQKVMEVFARRCNEIAIGKERAFMFQTALRVHADVRKAQSRARVQANEERVEREVDPLATPEEALTQKQARGLLDQVLDSLDADARVVFVLFEIEELSTQEIADLLRTPAGTVSSRLARARGDFEAASKRIRAGRQQ